MKVGLVTPHYPPDPGLLSRHVGKLADGLACRGVEVEVLAQGPWRRVPALAGARGVAIRRFSGSTAPAQPVVVPGLWQYVRRTLGSFDLIDVHSADAMLGLAVSGASARNIVFTVHRSVPQLLRWPYARATRTMVARALYTACPSEAQADLLRRALGPMGARIDVVRSGVDVSAIQAADPFDENRSVVLTVGRLERNHRVDRVIAAMAGLDLAWRLVVVGDGPLRRGLRAHAADLLVSSRVAFAGAVSDMDLYRWLRTARVLVALGDWPASGLQVLEARAAGIPVVATDNAVHREAVSHTGDAGVVFVPPGASPLTLADAIRHAASLGVGTGAQSQLPTWDDLIEGTLRLYERALDHSLGATDPSTGNGTAGALRVAGDPSSLWARS